MESIKEMAVQKLQVEYDQLGSVGRYEEVVKLPVMRALCDFCQQDEEFAQAVVDCGDKSLKACLSAVVKDCGNALSDCDAYRRAASYYFDGAKVEMQMVIHVNPYVGPGSTTVKTRVINLMDLL
ncbi:MAG: hypothetical protein ACI3XE_02035 [Eubacteriales bacterium]